MTEEYHVEMSSLCQEFEEHGQKVKIDIFRGDHGGWILEVIDQNDHSTMWDDEFPTEKDALDEAINSIKEEGILSFINNSTFSKVQ